VGVAAALLADAELAAVVSKTAADRPTRSASKKPGTLGMSPSRLGALADCISHRGPTIASAARRPLVRLIAVHHLRRQARVAEAD